MMVTVCIFVHILGRLFSRLNCHFGAFIADYAVWALLIVEGRTVTYSC